VHSLELSFINKAFDKGYMIHDFHAVWSLDPNSGDDLNIGVSGQGIKTKASFSYICD